MAISPFALFIRKNAKNASLKKLSVPARGKALGKLYKALPAAEKAALVKTAKTTAAPKRIKIVKSVLVRAKALGVPSTLVKKQWFKTKGSSSAAKLRKIAKANKIQVRKIVVAEKKPATKKPAAKKPVSKKAATKKTVKK